MRKSGVLMAVSSLPGKYGIGCFSKEAYAFVDDLKAAGQSLWQILPLGPTSYGDSPYQSFSTFAGNPYYVDPETLIEKKWLTKKECDSYDWGSDPAAVDYEKIYRARFRLLKKAYKRSDIGSDKGFRSYVKANAYWLPDYALFMALKDAHKVKSWEQWEKPLHFREKSALASVADTAIIPMQDVLSLPRRARMNAPSTIGGNWQWRMKEGAFSKTRQNKLKKLTELYGRARI